jgi:hypothetical protein
MKVVGRELPRGVELADQVVASFVGHGAGAGNTGNECTMRSLSMCVEIMRCAEVSSLGNRGDASIIFHAVIKVRSFSSLALALILGVACRRPTSAAVRPAGLKEGHCWWAVLRSTRPPDSVAARFTDAFIQAGFSTVIFKRNADTAWSTASATQLDIGGPATFTSRAIAYWHGDSTHFRYFVDVQPSSGASPDSVDRSKNVLAFCSQIARSAAIGWSAPRDPTGDEGLAIWSRVP